MSSSLRLRDSSGGLQPVGVTAHLAILAGLLASFYVVSAMSYWYRSRTESLLELSIRQDLYLHDRLPKLRDDIRQIHSLTEAYAKSGDANLLAQRRRAIADVQSISEDVGRMATGRKVHYFFPEYVAQLNEFLGAEEKWSDQRTDSFSNQRRLDCRDRMDILLELIVSMSDSAISGIQNRTRLVESVSYKTFLFRLGIELAATMLIGAYLYRYIIRPIVLFERQASFWRLGDPWQESSVDAIPEIRNLFNVFAAMTHSLNEQYGREKALNELKTKLVSLVSHEFANSLTVIQNAGHILKDPSGVKRERMRPMIDMILAHAQLLSSAVNNLLSLSRIEAGKLAMNFGKTRLMDMIRSTVNRLELLASQKRIHVSVQIPEVTEPVRADEPTLSLVLSNLVGNAIKYTPEDGRVVVGVMIEPTRPECYRIFVEDTGIGVSKEDRDKILRGFYRTQDGQRMTNKGFGIGLSLARQIIEAHGSSLELESRIGKGSKFSFLLPIWQDEAVAGMRTV